MARYTGPKRKLERREQTTLFSSNKWQARPGAPGQHPFTRGRLSEYGQQLREVQKVKRTYGLLEKQFRRLMQSAQKADGNTGTILLQLLESRLDNLIFKLGLAKTRMQARQFVTHGHVKVNGKKLDIPSYNAKVGDKIELDKKIMDSNMGQIIYAELEEVKVPEWLERSKNSGIFKSMPARSQLDQSINERLIIEFYSR